VSKKLVSVEPAGPLKGRLTPPGDKSISHRSLLFNALASGSARITGLLESEDVAATRTAVEALGVTVDEDHNGLVLRSTGALSEPADVIDCGNSGTSMRLLSGALAATPFVSVLTGDASLRSRPMGRVVNPLRKMGAAIEGREKGTLAPLAFCGGTLEMGNHQLKVASAQVKSALLLAGLRSGVAVKEPRLSRDHTERMLTAMGAVLRRDREGWLVLLPPDRLEPVDVDVPSDMSSAAFFLVAGAIVPGSEIYLRSVGTNPTRSGVVDALLAMGADIQVFPRSSMSSEPRADLLVRAGRLMGTRIAGELALRCLDELPVLAVAAAFAEGRTVIADAGELRVKESDRIARTVSALRALGVEVEEFPDGMAIEGGFPKGPALVDAHHDHRIAMAFAVAGLVAPGGVKIEGAESIRSSYPTFFEHVGMLRRGA
jgi:3-phosphoshikimate 1-carboxyvinyltransferase